MKHASFAIVVKQGEILLTKRRDVPVWVLPGGGIESGESPEEACLREVKEETGSDILIVKKTHEMSPLNRLALPTHLYLAEALSMPEPFSFESRENRFFPLNSLPKDLFWPHKLWVEEALSTKTLVKRPLFEITYGALFHYLIKHPGQVIRFLWTRFTQD